VLGYEGGQVHTVGSVVIGLILLRRDLERTVEESRDSHLLRPYDSASNDQESLRHLRYVPRRWYRTGAARPVRSDR